MYFARRELFCRTVYFKKDFATRGASASAARAIPQIFNLQSSIFNSGLSGLGLSPGEGSRRQSLHVKPSAPSSFSIRPGNGGLSQPGLTILKINNHRWLYPYYQKKTQAN